MQKTQTFSAGFQQASAAGFQQSSNARRMRGNRNSRGRIVSARGARGFSMMELLVAVLVMGIGVLGISALQMVSLQNNRGALHRAEAVQLAYDMLDRIKAHGTPALYDAYDMDDDPPAPTNCNAAICTPAQMAVFDRAVWKCLLGGHNDNDNCDDLRDNNVIPSSNAQPGLPQGNGSIAIDADGVITVTVRWQTAEGAEVDVSISGRG